MEGEFTRQIKLGSNCGHHKKVLAMPSARHAMRFSSSFLNVSRPIQDSRYGGAIAGLCSEGQQEPLRIGGHHDSIRHSCTGELEKLMRNAGLKRRAKFHIDGHDFSIRSDKINLLAIASP